jgi:hypothetical protein
MTEREAVSVLEAHGIRWTRSDSGWLRVWDECVKDGVVYGYWRNCPRTLRRLRAWLGY